ncbi:MAG TPA: 50S ribosomal protein L11 methyltransferase [Steroidobacteraceae bacterium]|nr:50S ribosomal protein L11 methyltransferase [Steroidobacteraceae bacterium]
MAHLKLSFELPGADAEPAEALLFETGAVSVGYFDAGDAPIHEPAPGATPLWPAVKVEALYPAEADPLLLEAVLRARFHSFPTLRFTTVDDRVWEREWLRDFRCMRFGQRLWVCPAGQRPADPDAVIVDLDPGLAFGTGTHATTALCLEWLDGAPLAGSSVLDYGSGSGILGIAALRLGAADVLAIDIDPQAREATRCNAQRNAVADRLEVADANAPLAAKRDIVLANILAGPLVDLARRLAGALRPEGHIVLSGILESQAATVIEAYRAWFDLDPLELRDGWARISGRRTADAHTERSSC